MSARSPRKIALVASAAFLALLGLLLYGVTVSDRPDRQSLPSPLIGKPAPAFSLPVLGEPDRIISADDLRGEAYLLNVWGSWCPACRIEHPVLTRFAQTGLVKVIGYNWKDAPDDAHRWLTQFGDPYALILADMEGRRAIDWGIYGAPETFLVDARGVVAWKHVGPLSDEVIAEQLLPLLQRLEHR